MFTRVTRKCGIGGHQDIGFALRSNRMAALITAVCFRSCTGIARPGDVCLILMIFHDQNEGIIPRRPISNTGSPFVASHFPLPLVSPHSKL